MLAVAVTVLVFSGCFAGKGKYTDKELVMDAQYYFDRGMKELKKKNYETAIEQLNTVVESFSGSAVVDSALFYLAEARFKNEDYLTAAYEYERVYVDYPSSEFVAEAQYKKALSYSMESPKANLDQENTRLAIDEFKRFIENHPGHRFAEEAQKRIDELTEKLAYRDYLIAELYRKMKSPESFQAALIYYRAIIKDYPRSIWAWYARYGIGVVHLKQKEYELARTAFSELASAERAPSDLKKKAAKNIKSIESNAAKR